MTEQDHPQRAKRPGKYVPDVLRRCGLPDCDAEIPYPSGLGRARYETRRRCPEHRTQPDPRPSKRCECGCGETFERPAGTRDMKWAQRRYLDVTHRRRAEKAKRQQESEADAEKPRARKPRQPKSPPPAAADPEPPPPPVPQPPPPPARPAWRPSWLRDYGNGLSRATGQQGQEECA